MAHWFDDFTRSLARSTFFGGYRGANNRAADFALVKSPAGFTLEAGPCGMRLEGNELTERFATQIATEDGRLVSLVAATISDREQGSVRSSMDVRFGDASVLEFRSVSAPDEPATLSIFLGSGFQGVHDVQARVVDGRLEGMIDGRSWVPVALAAEGQRGIDPKAMRFADGSAMPESRFDATIAAALRDIANKAQRDMPACVQLPENLMLDSASGFAGCDDCNSACIKTQNLCIAEAFVKALGCGPFYGACVAGYGASCLSDSSDCQNACHNPPGPCCPRQCEQGGYAECCLADATCCGSRCCPAGHFCADSAHSLCCEPNGGPPCNEFCCPHGTKCASLTRSFCCPSDAGEYCLKVWDEEHWNDSCCPPGEVCADSATGLCCPRDHGPICGAACCKSGEICRNGVCCDPRFLCGDGDRAECCVGKCRNGECCSAPSHMCGDACCPPFNPCCRFDGQDVCCGAYDTCTDRGCCPSERLCGRTCCPPGNMCADFDREKCVPCPRDLFPCETRDLNGRMRGMCCLPQVTCCAKGCCAPGEACCAPDGKPESLGCHPSAKCLPQIN